MFCPHCGRNIGEGIKSCPYCDKKIDDAKKDGGYPQIPSCYRIEKFSSAPDRAAGIDSRVKKSGCGIGELFRRGIKVVFYACLFFAMFALIFGPGSSFQKQAKIFISKTSEIADVDFPASKEYPKTIDFRWTYDGGEYVLEETLYGNINSYYNGHPVKSFYEGVSRDEYYENFARNLEHTEDGTVAKIAGDLRALGAERGFSEDETLELMVAFVQAIPYDDEKFAVVENTADGVGADVEGTWPRFPYEVLYDDTGICTDKSLLTVALAEELGYGTALFGFESEEHMAPAIACTAEYSSYGSGYCYAEVTNTGFKIGDSDVRDIESGKALTRTSINSADDTVSEPSDADTLADFQIYDRREGKIYAGIIETVATMKKIAELEDRISAMNPELEALKNDYLAFEGTLEYRKKESDKAYRTHLSSRDAASYDKYLKLFEQYNAAYAQYEKKVDVYNAKVVEYNRTADEYNELIGSFYD